MLPAETLVLVAILPDPRDLEITHVLGWYRIPYCRLPKTIDVEYLVFYRTARLGAEKRAIHYVAPVLGHELTTRAELLWDDPDHPRAGEQYFKPQLGALQPLPRPIPLRTWQRITFLNTTGECLNSAEEINQLIVGSAERELLWTGLRERGSPTEKDYRSASGRAEFDRAVLCRLGDLGITLGDAPAEPPSGGWTGPYLPERTLCEQPLSVLSEIMGTVKNLGGARDEPTALEER